MAAPHIRRTSGSPQLVVEDRPFLILGGELENSASTGRRYMAAMWPRLAAANLNTVLAAVPWDLVEPVEGQFDFQLVDELIEDARAHGLKLVLLWFGTWKNGLTHYAPGWVKRDTTRFERARIAQGALEMISPLSEAACEADSRAFAALMAHVGRVDRAQQTVIMVQVENEVGLFGADRDYSATATAAFNAAVPQDLLDYLSANRSTLLPETEAMLSAPGAKASGSWREVFPAAGHAEAAFMAWHYARFLGRVAAAGKAAYDIPMFANAALDSPVPHISGPFRGGPEAHLADIWRAGAPAIDMLSPDIYAIDYNGFLQLFNRGGNPLFVPESRTDHEGVANAFVTLGKGGIGYSPFGVEARSNFETGGLPEAYRLLADLAPVILEHQARGATDGLRVSPHQPVDRISLGGYDWTATRLTYWRLPDQPKTDFGGAIVMQTGPEEFIIAGTGIQMTFAVSGRTDRIVGIESLDELLFVDGQWVRDRRLSGDEIMTSYDVPALMPQRQNGTQVKFWSGPQVLRLKLYSYEC